MTVQTLPKSPTSPARPKAGSQSVRLGSRLGAVIDAVLRAAVASNVWVSACAASLTWLPASQLGIPFDARAPWIVFASGMAIYNLDDLFETRPIDAVAVGRTHLPRWLRIAFVVGGLVASASWVASGPLTLAVLVASGGLVCACYGLPVVPSRNGMRLRLKDVPTVKGWLVAGAIAVATLFVPLTLAGDVHLDGLAAEASGLRCLALFGFVFVICYTNVQLFDLRDIEDDRQRGVPTMPVVLGATAVRRALSLLNLASAGMLVYAHFAFDVASLAEAGILAVAALTVTRLRTWRRETFDFAVDGAVLAGVVWVVIA